MENLILNILYQFDDWGDSIRFTKEEIGKLIKDNKITEDNNYNEYGTCLLWDNNFISNESFASDMDLKYEKKKGEKGGDFYLIIDSFGDVLDNKQFSNEIEYLDGDYDWDHYGDYDAGIDYYWSNYTDETMEEMVNFLIRTAPEIDTDDGGIVLTEDNTRKDGYIDIGDEWVSIESLIDEDGLDELKDKINGTICDAQYDADINEVINSLINSFEEKIGTYERIMVKKKYYDHDSKSTKEKDSEVIKIKLNDGWYEGIKDVLKDDYKYDNHIDFEEERYGSFISIAQEYGDYFDIDTPDYNYVHGSIDDTYLNEALQERLQYD